MSKRKRRLGKDLYLIYESEEDGGWVAHSLRTDQIGTGDSIVEALSDLMRGIKNLLELAREHDDVEVLRDAPQKLQREAEKAKPLPREIYEIAYKKVHGSWPEELKIDFIPKSRRRRPTFRAETEEPVLT